MPAYLYNELFLFFMEMPALLNSPPYMIGIAGGSASGKTSVAERIVALLGVSSVVLISMDSFYKPLTIAQTDAANANDYDFDHPNAFDYDLLFDILAELKSGRMVEVPRYCFQTHSRLETTTEIHGANVVIFEGILALFDDRVIHLF